VYASNLKTIYFLYDFPTRNEFHAAVSITRLAYTKTNSYRHVMSVHEHEPWRWFENRSAISLGIAPSIIRISSASRRRLTRRPFDVVKRCFRRGMPIWFAAERDGSCIGRGDEFPVKNGSSWTITSGPRPPSIPCDRRSDVVEHSCAVKSRNNYERIHACVKRFIRKVDEKKRRKTPRAANGRTNERKIE